MGSKVRKQSMLIRCVKVPIKILAKARDLYVQNMSTSGMHVFYGSGMSCPTPQLRSLPRSVSVAYSNSSFSTSSDEYSTRPSPASRQGRPVPVPRSQSVTIGRIDENKCCEFEAYGGTPKVAYPRSRSCVTPRRSKIANGYHYFEKDFKYKRI